MKRLALFLAILFACAPVDAGIRYSYSPSTSSSDVVDDTTPQLGGDLDVNGHKIVSTSNGNIDIEPHGTGNVLLGNLTIDGDQTVGAGQDDYVLTYDHSSGLVALEAAGGAGVGGGTGSTDNAILRADGTGGATAQGSLLTIADTTGSITTNASGQDWALNFTDDQATGSITWSENANQIVFTAPPVYDSGGGYTTGNYVFQASSLSSQTSSRIFLRDNLAGRGFQIIANNADASIGIMHPSGGGAFYFPGAAAAIYPATAATSAISDPAANNGGVDFGGSSNRWNAVYSEAGDFSGEVKIADTNTGSNAGTDVCIDANNKLCACGSCA